MKITRNRNEQNKKGQSMVEYVILFTVIVAVVVVAITTFIKPSLEGLYQRTSGVLNEINPALNIH